MDGAADGLIIGHRIPVFQKSRVVLSTVKNGIIPSRKVARGERKGISGKISANGPSMCA